ncbi:MAG: hypothetical protein ACE5LQ_02525 [Candidatus Bipolaricaulia bacterium]
MAKMTKPEQELPASIVSRGQFTVTVASQKKREKILRLIEKAGTNVLSQAAWVAIDYYLDHDCREGRTDQEEGG